ncbi:NUDIX hydrolase [Paenibacillus bovis]|uniref:NUDIX domain-containing protein n=1 Tax=Paenibacillus bovis TaxID=1616788 RepID=A0A172ZJL4_9BACL|nr:NUDIX hydrolase [Paenibacillus bovis]ANF97834.1 NUDIX domain-containing protein [Paenibacillus bovis]
MITFKKGNNKFNFRVAGIAIQDNRVLLHTTVKDDFWNLPGGRVEFNESTEQAILREIKEELDVEVGSPKLLFINEDFFEYDSMQFHEIGFYYLVSFPEGHEITTYEDEFSGIEDEGRLIFKWFPVDELQDLEVYPEVLRSELLQLTNSNHIQHFVNLR